MDNSSPVIKNLKKFIKKNDGVKSEAVAQRSCTKKVFLEILQNLQEKTCAGVSFL